MKTNFEDIREAGYCYAAFRVVGDSMDNGLRDSFEDGDKLLVLPVSIEELKEGQSGFWVLEVGSSILFKQITKYDRGSETIVCHSLNPYYKDISVSVGQINKAYRVVQRRSKHTLYPAYEDI